MKISFLSIAAASVIALPAIAQNQALRIPASGTGDSKLRYEVRIDDKIIGEHPQWPNTWWNDRDENGVITGEDHRLRNHTVSAWVRRGSNSSGRVIGLNLGDRYQMSSLASYSLNFSSQLRYRTSSWENKGGTGVTWTTKADERSKTVLRQDEWMFVTVVIDDDNCMAYFYADGLLIGSQEMRVSNTHYGVGLYYLDCFFTFGHANLNLDIEEIQIWDHALTPEEVKRSARLTETKHEGLLGLWHFAPGADNSFANIADGGQDVPAVLVQGTTRSSGVTYYENVQKAEVEPEFTEGHGATEVTLSVDQPTEGGSIEIEGNKTSFNKFDEVRFGFKADEGWQPKSMTLNTGEVSESVNADAGQFIICGNASLSAEFTTQLSATCNIPEFGTVTMTANGENVDLAAGKYWMDKGSEVVFKLTPDNKYAVESFTINGVEHKNDIAADGTYTIANCNENVNATVKYRYNFAVLTFTASDGGNVAVTANGQALPFTAEGKADVEIGDNLLFTFDPYTDNMIWSVTVDGQEMLDRVDESGHLNLEVVNDQMSVDVAFRSATVSLNYIEARGGSMEMSVNGAEPTALKAGETTVPARGKLKLTVIPDSDDCTLSTMEVNGQELFGFVYDNTIELATNGENIEVKPGFDIRSYPFNIELIGLDPSEAIIEDVDHSTIYSSLNEEVLSGSHVVFTAYISDLGHEIISATEGDKSYEFSHGMEDDYKTGKIDFGYVTEPHSIKVLVADPKTAINPVEADGQATIAIDGLNVTANAAISVYDIAGTLVASSDNGRLSLASLTAGVYIVRSGNAAVKVVR